MKKLIVLLLLIPFLVFSQNTNDSILIEKNKSTIQEFNKKIKNLEEKFEYQVKNNEQTLNSISNQIGATSFNLSIFAFLFGILAIGLGVYITWVERKIIKIRGENESLLKKTIQTKNEVVAINELIQKDIYGLFIKIKREETEHILKRLVYVPKDVNNFVTQLVSRELIESDFELIKKAYLKLGDQANFKENYQIIIFQHFLDLALKDDEISKTITESYPICISCSFENDILKSTENFMKAIIDLGFQKKVLEINSFFKGLSSSQHKNYNKIYEIIFNSLNNRDNQFKFYLLIDKNENKKIAKLKYGKLLIDKYSKNELSISELNIIDDVNSIQNDLDRVELQRIEVEERNKKK
ncbi:hypothetical protein KO506_12855 [Polaribacter vadi]|uniref:hypothetical protein n=1 Tax=Polaribacter TaxID=52959 RepID=UPI001C08979E|nr:MULTISPECIES: hypothetical protein [Polaribacter]MBU3012298.1 hypothetical protein [Polaribacter vadi]MDO6742115.1 hypothetical protein [Polaribacter sp. 1_MG-2023]